ncbi:MAG: ABC transporter permease [Candidatus Sumerlaeia bacterium]|nr:ABC transporter permease [Candidatus Sumerlaeia bacterium]
MAAFILKRLLLAVPMVIGSSLLVFGIFYFSKLDPVRRLLGERSTNEELVQKMREDFGLNRPAHIRYFDFLGGVARGDFGRSMATREPVMKEIRQRFPATLELTMAAMLVSATVGLLFGIVAAFKKDTWIDYACMGFSLAAVSLPVFWLALMLSYYFSEKLGWFPLQQRYALRFSGEVPTRTGLMLVDSAIAGRWDVFGNVMRHLALPAITLAAVTSALVARMTRASVLDVLRQDFVRTAQAKGLRPARQLLHVMRNALIPIVTIIGLEIPALLGGAVITETIFAWPGMGKYLVDSILSADILAVQGVIMFMTLVFIAMNLLVDVSYAFIDPRVRDALAGPA